MSLEGIIVGTDPRDIIKEIRKIIRMSKVNREAAISIMCNTDDLKYKEYASREVKRLLEE